MFTKTKLFHGDDTLAIDTAAVFGRSTDVGGASGHGGHLTRRGINGGNISVEAAPCIRSVIGCHVGHAECLGKSYAVSHINGRRGLVQRDAGDRGLRHCFGTGGIIVFAIVEFHVLAVGVDAVGSRSLEVEGVRCASLVTQGEEEMVSGNIGGDSQSTGLGGVCLFTTKGRSLH